MDFEIGEYTGRVERLRVLMSEENLKAILINDIMNLTYYSGLRSIHTPRWREPYVLIVPLDEDPVVMFPEFMEEPVKKDSWIRDTRPYYRFEEPSMIDLVKKTSDDIGISRGRMGIEIGWRQRLTMNHTELTNLMKGMPGIEFVDASDILWRIRMVKTKPEIECLRRACDITSRAFEKFYVELRKGTTEREMFKMMYTYMIEQYPDLTHEDMPGYCWPTIFPGGVYLSTPSDRALKEGDYLYMDAGAIVKGYKSDFSRMGVVGPPTPKMRKVEKFIIELTDEVIDAVRPGVDTNDIYNIYEREWKKSGRKAGHPGFIGHGLGLDQVEPPEITSRSLVAPTVLETGMTLSIEPGELSEFGFMDMEENILVTESGAEILSWAPRGLHVV